MQQEGLSPAVKEALEAGLADALNALGVSGFAGIPLGMVGVGRYANECFPPFVGIGQLLERWSTRVRALYFVASTVGLVLFAVVAARYDLVP